MAHSCPECGCTCYCGGDIDDINLDDPAAVQACTCCSDLPEKDYGDYWLVDNECDDETD